jgi:hypothetical protein
MIHILVSAMMFSFCFLAHANGDGSEAMANGTNANVVEADKPASESPGVKISVAKCGHGWTCEKMGSLKDGDVLKINGAIVQLSKYDFKSHSSSVPIFLSGFLDGMNASLVAPCNLKKAPDYQVMSRVDDPTCRWIKETDPRPCNAVNMIKEFTDKGFVEVQKTPAFDITVDTEAPEAVPGMDRPLVMTATPKKLHSITMGYSRPDSRWGDNCYYRYERKK